MKRYISFIILILVSLDCYSLQKRFAKILESDYKNLQYYEVFSSALKNYILPSDKNDQKPNSFVPFTDEWLYKNFESKGKKYVIVTCFLDRRSYCEHIYSTGNDLPKNKYVFAFSESEFNDMSKLAKMATEDEVMIDLFAFFMPFNAIYYYNDQFPIFITYFDGKEQKTAYFRSVGHILDYKSKKEPSTEYEKKALEVVPYALYLAYYSPNIIKPYYPRYFFDNVNYEEMKKTLDEIE